MRTSPTQVQYNKKHFRFARLRKTCRDKEKPSKNDYDRTTRSILLQYTQLINTLKGTNAQ